MKVLKVFFIILGIALFLGLSYILALMGPGAKLEQDFTFVDPEADARSILLESETLEAEFEKAAAVSKTVTKENLEKLRRAIALQEIYINKARNMDRAPAERLTKLQTRINNIEATPLKEKLDIAETRAISASEKEDFKNALEYFKEAYELQSKINNEFPLSSYKDIRKLVRLDREVKMLQARPLYMETVSHQTSAEEAVKAGDWQKARSEYEKTIELLVKLNNTYSSSIYADFARLQKLELELESLKSTDVQLKIESFERKANELEAKGDYLAASEAFADAEVQQRNLNSLFPKSRHASDEKLAELGRKKENAYSWKFGREIINQQKQMTQALLNGEIKTAVEISGNLLKKVEQFKSDFPRSQILEEDLVMRLRYINYMSNSIADIQKIVKEDLSDIGNGVFMGKHEVSQNLYKMVMQENPSRETSSIHHPVDSVNYDDVMRFCNRLSWILGKKVSIPTVEQFTKCIGSLRYVNLNDIAWSNMNSDGRTHAVGTKKPNDKGFYDLLGNVAEYVSSLELSVDTVQIMGGSSQSSTDEMLDLAKAQIDSRQRNRMVGFRIIVIESK